MQIDAKLYVQLQGKKKEKNKKECIKWVINVRRRNYLSKYFYNANVIQMTIHIYLIIKNT